MKLTAVELRRVAMPLVSPFRTSFGTQTRKDVLLVKVITTDGYGWGECAAPADPVYSPEYAAGAEHVIRTYLIPRLRAYPRLSSGLVAPALAGVKGHPMAKAAIEMAVLDAELRSAGQSFATFLGAVRDRVPAGVSVGIMDSIPALLEAVGQYVDEGYQRVKVKIQPGWDVEPVRALRERFGDAILLQVDANTAYTLRDAHQLARLDAFGLVLIEQPLAEDDLGGHAALARLIKTPVCLDESVTSARTAAAAIIQGACAVVNIKPGRVGGYLEARRVAAVCAAHGVPAWCGGMVETGLGRAGNAALAALPEFTLPGDVSGSDRFWAQDITEPLLTEDGFLPVPHGPGLGVEPIAEILKRHTVSVVTLHG